ncbi:MAG: protein-methionine-sulfoxide reductase catalytic subunit MsrP [Pseudomonadota bacterium]
MLIRKASSIRPSEITAQSVYNQRREFLRSGIYAFAGLAMPRLGLALADKPGKLKPIENLYPSRYRVDAEVTDYKWITTYNNFTEFGHGKSTPAKIARKFRTTPWSVTVDGECEKPGKIAIEDLLSKFAQEERIYRFRCVEAWSMVVPWVGFPLGDLLKRFKPTSKAKYVAFETLHDPKRMPNQRYKAFDWPYREGLRMDEAMHPLTILATGLYGEVLPNQNGAPLRLVVPWKYGFKSIKSIVGITFTEREPPTTWNGKQPDEYGFYANVNPRVDHPRWSQAKHRVLGGGIFSGREKTLLFNGYADDVASLYSGMDLKKHF